MMQTNNLLTIIIQLLLSIFLVLPVVQVQVQADSWLTDWFDVQTRNDFCQDQRTDKQKLDDDIPSKIYINGSLLGRMENVGINELDQLLIANSRFRGSITSCLLRQWGYKNDNLFYLGNTPMRNDTQCHLELDQLYDYMISLKNETKFVNNNSTTAKSQAHLYRQLASFGRVPIGPIESVNYWLGDVEQCSRLESTRHCFAAYETTKPKTIGSYDISDHRPKDFGMIYVSLCLPLSCTSKLSQDASSLKKIQELAYYNLISGYRLNDPHRHKVNEIYCPPAEKSHWRNYTREPLARILILIGFIWFLWIGYCTIMSQNRSVTSKQANILNLFNISNNWEILSSGKNSNEPELTIINFAKSIGMVLILSNHLLMMFMTISRDLSVVSKHKIMNAVFQAQHNVSMFFLVSAFLVAYNHFKFKKRILSPFRLVLKRYLRLLPMYLVTYAIVKQFAHAWGSGPFWDHAVSPQSPMALCKSESWLYPILMVSNWILPSAHCVLTGWYLAVEFQIYCLLPLILYVYDKSKTFGRIATFIIIAFSSIYRIWFLQTSDNYSLEFLFSDPMVYGPTAMAIRLWDLYGSVISRISTAFIGVLLASSVISATKRQTREFNSKHNIEYEAAIETHKDSSNSYQMELVAIRAINHSKQNRHFETETSKHQNSFVAKIWYNYVNNPDKNRLPFLLFGIISLGLAYWGILLPDSTKYMYGRYSKGMTYGMTLVSVDWAWFCLLYVFIVNKHKNILIMNHYRSKPLSPSWIGFIDSNFWYATGKLCLANMLTHDSIIRSFMHSSPQLIEFNYTSILMWCTFCIILCHLFSVFIFICLESPLNEMSKLFLYGKTDATPLQQVDLDREANGNHH